MDEPSFEVKVDKYLEDLIPEYLNNRHKEVALLGDALEASDFEQIAQLAHRMIGVGTPFGFGHITSTARKIREAALTRDHAAIQAILADYGDYVSRVRVVYE